MNITFTDEAVKRLEKLMCELETSVLQLKYDTDGCGCVVNGVAMLFISEKAESDYLKVDTNYKPIYLPKEAIVYWDDNMTIGYVEKYNCFQLKSSVQMINPRMSLINECQSA
ncbi:hypothetical protein CIB95_03790 [Lottiidibacillus patelloidae]|uniref:Core domain-containing protein n=1 Tax=Lottiidibacillus patelloidae TaxID=2670334 RepID=A0A263BYH0_9BACI|nr:iron-sulfur cluster biosynthesis family protein [Lottiidibacillus patelloidae]OZM58700.1 hypothetical protein CIB95_03790 [Lottiidibacillus patelloidae]